MKKLLSMLAIAAMFMTVSCKKDNPNNDDPLDDPQEETKEVKVAEDALVAYFPLDDATEKVGNLTLDSQGSGTDANFVAGRRGKCYTGTPDSYLRFNLPADSPLKDLKAMSVSMWIKHKEIDISCAPTPMVFQITRSDDRCWGNFAMGCDRTDKGAGFLTWKVQFQSQIETKDESTGEVSYAPGNIWKTSNISRTDETTGITTWDWANIFPVDRWLHIIWCYDNKTSQFHCYVNGMDVTPVDEEKGINYVDCTFGEDNKPFGDLKFLNAEQVMIGNWDVKYTSASGWGWGDNWIGGFENGMVDEIRVFNRSLTATEAKALYDAEVNAMDD